MVTPGGERKWGEAYPLSFPRRRGARSRRRPPSFPCSHPSPPTSTSSPSSRPSWPAGPTTASSSGPLQQRAGRPALGLLRGPADRQRHARACTTSGPGSTRTCSAASAPWTGRTWPAGPAGTPTGSRSRSRWRRSSGSRARSRSRSRSGIAEFTRLCRESVYSYVDEFARLTTRIGYWVDMDAAYWTLSPDYIESVWWHLQQLFDQGLLYEDLKVVPYCPRCGTALSQPRARAARRVPRRGGRVGLRAVAPGRPRSPGSAVGAAVAGGVDDHAVDPAVEHRRGGEPRTSSTPSWTGRWWPTSWSTPCSGRAPPARVTARVPGAALVGLHYERPFDDLDPPPGADGWRVVPGRLRHDGGGHRPRAPGPGLRRGRPPDRPRERPALAQPGRARRALHRRRRLAGGPGRARGQPRHQRPAGVRRASSSAACPTCTRTRTAGAAARRSSTGASRAGTSPRRPARTTCWRPTQTVDWHPAHIKDGRFGEWLANNVDWALSRDRYWGTPLPIWRCGRGHLRCVGSLAELSDLCGRDVTGHRPAPADHRRGDVRLLDVRRRGDRVVDVDGDELAVSRRVEPVIDAWFDSGSMPAAQVGYPHAEGLGGGLHLPGRLHLRGHRPDAGLVLLAAGHQHPGVRREPVPPRRVPRPHRRRRRPQDVEVARQHHRPLDDPRHAGRRRHALVDVQPGVAVDADPGDAGRHRRGHARHAAHAVEHVQLLHDLRVAERVRPRRRPTCRRRPTAARSTAGSCPAWPPRPPR